MAFLTTHASNTVFRDNIHDNRLIPVSDGVLKVIGTDAFQRLRYIRQMGLAHYVFPTAEHSRFVHSLGVYATARAAFRALRQKAERLAIPFAPMRFDEEAEKDFQLAAMLHDVGHTAFSHALEHLLLPNGFRRHEECTLHLIRDNPSLNTAIRNFADLDAVVLLIDDQHPNRALSQLISGLLDIDRSDYLVRDCHNAGVRDGLFDLPWLLHSLSVDLNSLDQPVLQIDGSRGVEALRQFLGARRRMYRQVYYQATIRAAQVLLIAIFERARDEGVCKPTMSACPPSLHNALRGETVTEDDFLDTTDVEVIYAVKALRRESTDPVMRLLCEMFVRRDFPKTILDSAKSHSRAYAQFGIEFSDEGESTPSGQIPLFLDDISFEADFIAQCREVVESALEGENLPTEIARYLVRPDRARMKRYPPSDIVLAYHDTKNTLEKIQDGVAASVLPELNDNFEIYRLFVPAFCQDRMRKFAAEQLRRWS